MCISKQRKPIEKLTLNQTPIEHVEKNTYLGTIVHSQWNMAIEIKSRIEEKDRGKIEEETSHCH